MVPPARRLPLRALAAVYGTAWALLAAGYVAVPAAQAWCSAGISVTATAAVLHGARRHRPRAAAAWHLLAAALLTFVVGDSTYSLVVALTGAQNPFPSVADPVYLLTYPLLAASLATMRRRREVHHDRGALLDALCVTLGLGLVAWTYVVTPTVVDASAPLLQRVVSSAYPLGDVLCLAMLARLLSSGGRRSRSLVLLAAGAVLLLLVDVVYALLQLQGTWVEGGGLNLVWFACYALWGLAALDPSMRELTEPQPAAPPRLRGLRLAALAGASLVAPAILLQHAVAGSERDLAVIAVSSGALFVVVLVRLADLVGAQQASVEREVALRGAAAELAAATTTEDVRATALRAVPAVLGPGLRHDVVLDGAAGGAGPAAVALRRCADGGTRLLERSRGEVPVDLVHWAGARDVLLVPVRPRPDAAPDGVVVVAGTSLELLAVQEALQTLVAQVVLAHVRAGLDAALVARRSEERFRALVQNTSDVILVLDEAERVRFATPSVARLLGWPPEEVEGCDLRALVHPDDVERVLALLVRVRAAAGPGTHTADLRLLGSGSPARAVEVEAVMSDLRGEEVVRGLVLTLRDVTERRTLERELAHRAFHDGLTGLANRVLFNERVAQALARRSRGGGAVSVLFCDLDDFKEVNDTLGHGAGDDLIVQVSRRVEGVARAGDTAARLGGDEFALLLEDVEGPEHVDGVAARLVAALSAPFELAAGTVSVSGSVGIASDRDAGDVGELLRQADLALYAAKEEGKRRWRRFEPLLQTSMTERLETRADLEAGLATGQFHLVHQPVVETGTGRVVALEALLRWQHPERGLVGPDEFLPVAEATGLIVPLGRWALQQALRELASWDGAAPRLHVNVSAVQMRLPGVVDEVRDALAAAGVAPGRLVVELTESLLLEDDRVVRDALAGLKGMGVHLAIDDFGTGYSSLGYLRSFPVDILKIDKSFVRGLDEPGQEALVDAIVRIARTLDLELVAEGVEREDQRTALDRLGCTHAQGWLFSSPVPAAAVPALLARPDLLPRPELVAPAHPDGSSPRPPLPRRGVATTSPRDDRPLAVALAPDRGAP
ncbi:EAL domain-containing protein [Vallicoccus soli]|uniref:EAL domain-containing protein n=1 Tax=Vallicoccus soli TaxID=2339232 RepID=A0A3A3YR20_9ACTN|nr:EAL domain-containing protein [Vallicoccus soli]